MTTVLIADDEELVRTGLRTILERRPGIEVVGEAANGRDAVVTARRLRPDVVLMDVRMPTMDGITATRELLARGAPEDGPRVIVLTTFDLDEYVYEALRAGASGFLLKDTPPDRLVAAIEAVVAGDALFSPSVTRRLVERYVGAAARRAEFPQIDEMTAREREVLTLVARGLSNGEIARALVVSVPTVKTHVGRILLKLGVRDRVQAVVVAYEAGIVVPGDPPA